MGCHTWFARRSWLTSTSIKMAAIASARESITRWIQVDEQMLDALELTLKDKEKQIEWTRRCLSRIENGSKEGSLNMAKAWMCRHRSGYTRYKNELYLEHKDYHDTFRVGGYPEDILTNLNETLMFCEKHDIDIGDKQFDTICKWWNEFSNGIIYFG